MLDDFLFFEPVSYTDFVVDFTTDMVILIHQPRKNSFKTLFRPRNCQQRCESIMKYSHSQVVSVDDLDLIQLLIVDG